MIKTLTVSTFLIISSAFCLGQTIPKEGYHPPLGIPLILSSNFGELRPNHFHMGIDFKTNNKIGYNLYAIEEGFVSRVKVSPYGYGRVVYVDHPNGITSVYAHCSEFKGKLDSLVRAEQEKAQNFEVDIHPKPSELKLKRGEIFALSGNTGSSTAPHVHFEIRDTKTEAALNPLVFGFDIADSKKPEIRGLKIYALTKDGYCLPNKSVGRVVKMGTYGYYIGADKVTIPANFCTTSGGIGMAFDVIDQLDGAGNHCGLYGSILIVDGDTLFGQRTDRVPFESTRYVNSHKDFVEYSVNHKKYHKCFKTTENDLPIYRYGKNGIIPAKPGDKYQIEYIAYDPKGNKSVLKFELEIAQGEINPTDGIGVDLSYLQPAYPLLMNNENREVEFGITTTYEPLKMDESKLNYSIGSAEIPVHKPYRVKIKSSQKPDGKQYIEFTTAKGSVKTLVATFDDGWYSAESTYFGSYKLKRDTIPPTISTLNFKSTTTATSLKSLTWKIADAHTGIADYDIFLDGKWYVLEYEYKGNYVTFNLPTGVNGTKKVTLHVVDKVGNVKEWEKEITFR